ncbi:MAG: hypothetical protein DMF74_27760 [Acidobacteria bacterium]|nr:MAG: hypothetical protein DMF74_27760 [Acidobacteriota bacterium]
MKKVGRNDPCPCGSGKKYKTCCLASSSASDFQYRHSRQTHASLIPKLMKFAFENFGPELVDEAWNDFNDDDAVDDYQPESPMEPIFMPWFLFNWIVELKPREDSEYSETTIAELFIVHERKRINTDEEALLRSAIRCPYSLCEVVEVRARVGLTLFDLLRRIPHEVVERSASQTLKRGEIIYCATTEVDGFRSNVGTGPYALRPTAKRDVLDLRKWILDQIDDQQITSQHLHEFEHDIRGLYLHLLRGMFTPPTLVNTDGDPMLPQKLYFDLESADKAFHALKDLSGGLDEIELLRDATIKDGLVTKAEISWLGGSDEARKRLAGPVLLGLFKIDDERLVIEVNSTKRAELARRLVEERLGEAATYKTTLVESIEPRFQEMWRAAAAEPGSSSSGQGSSAGSGFISLDDAPELRAMMEETARQHWEAWFDLPVPALNDMTPRAAAETEEGRELLDSLLLLYENHAENSSDNILRPDVAALRRELGMK